MGKALYIHGSGGSPVYTAEDDRVLLASLLGGDPFTDPSAGLGMVGRGHGVLSGSSMLVSAGGAQNVSTALGMASIRGTRTNQFGAYLARNDAAIVTSVANRHATLSRKDLVIAEVRDNSEDAGGANDWRIRIVQGSDNASPVDPAVPESSLVLARLTIPGGAATFTVTAGMIADLRPQARATGGITILSDHTTFPNPQTYDFVYNSTTQTLYMYSASTTSWIQVGQNYSADWTSFTPDFDGSVTIGNGTRWGRYVRLGRTVLFVAGFQRGTTTTQSGTLKIDLALSGLPAAATPTSGSWWNYMGGAKMIDDSTGLQYASTCAIKTDVQEITNFATLGLPVWSPTSPVTWATLDRLHAFGTYETAS